MPRRRTRRLVPVLAGILVSVLAMCEKQTDRTEVAAEFDRFEKLFTTMWS